MSARSANHAAIGVNFSAITTLSYEIPLRVTRARIRIIVLLVVVIVTYELQPLSSNKQPGENVIEAQF